LIRYWYRQSPGVLFPFSEQLVTSWDPPQDVPGMVLLRLDTEGKLNYFQAAPEQVPSSGSQVSSTEPASSLKPQVPGSTNPNELETRNLKLGTGTSEAGTRDSKLETASADSKLETDLWSALFGAAGLDINEFQPTESLWTPPHAYDARQAWTGFYPNLPNVPIRVEAASFHNRPVYFTIVGPWNKTVSERADPRSLGEKIGVWILFAIFFGILVVGALLALRNLRLGRGDRRGAFRLALFVFLSRILVWVFSTHHVADNVELLLLVTGIQSALFWSCFVGVMYLALEPYLRRRWPEKIISWNRLLVGDFRDPLVGRDILVGLAIGAFCVLLMYLRVVLPYWIASFRSMPDFTDGFEFGMSGASAFLQMFINQVTASMIQTFMVVFLLLFLTLLFRREWLGVTVGTLIWIAFFFSSEISYTHWIGLVCIALAVIAFVFCAENFGPVALMSALMVFHLWVFYPITTELTAWYASSFVFCTVILLALAVYAFYISLGGQKVFKGRLLQED
jgi:serine/threonine-protein kinase